MAETISDTSVSSDELVSCPESSEDSGVMAARTINPVGEHEQDTIRVVFDILCVRKVRANS